MVIFALTAISKMACLLFSRYICSINGLRDTNFMLGGMLCLLIDSTGFVVPGRSSQSSSGSAVYALLSFFKMFGRLHQFTQVSAFFQRVVSTSEDFNVDKFGGRLQEKVSKDFALHKTSKAFCTFSGNGSSGILLAMDINM